jgi:NAD(P)-dependent dehydrogenase (short-subunit alcohol dehydrogenase family)
MSIWFITGANRGFGLELATLALSNGDAVVAAARRPDQAEKALGGPQDQLLTVPLDVTDEGQAQEAVRLATDRFGGIDVLVNNAGRGFTGAVEEASGDEVRATFDVNVFGLLSVTRAVVPVMRRQRSGHVINVGSVGGVIGRPGAGIYCASKFAVEGLTEALRGELGPLGIRVSVIEPGAFRTDFLDSSSMVMAQRVFEDYDATAGEFRRRPSWFNHQQPGDPRKVAQAIVALVTSDDPPARLALGRDAVAGVEEKLSGWGADLARWREVSTSTDFDA